MFHPSAKDWPTRHKILGYIFLGALTILLLGYFLYIRPQRELFLEKKQIVKEKSDEFNAKNLPFDSLVLKGYLKTTSIMLNGDEQSGTRGLNAICESTLTAATVSLNKKILQNYSDMLAFIYGATRLDYKELLEQIVSEFSDENTLLDTQLLGSDQDTQQEMPVWQMMTKLWVLQDLLQKARQSGLKLKANEEGKAQIAALPAVGYTIEDSTDGKVYLLEIPVSATFQGTMTQFLDFVGSLQTAECFLPLRRLTISTLPPAELATGEDNAVEECIFDLQCSEFMMPHGLDELPETNKENAEPLPTVNSETKEEK